MKGNQGLEALAALCGGQSTEASSGNPRDTGRHTVMGSSTGSHSSNNSGSHQSQSAQESNHVQASFPIQQSQLQNLTPQQWQQALTALQNSHGVNHNALAQSLLLSGLGGQAVQQFAYQHLAQAQAQANISAAQQAAIAQSVGSYGDASHQALLMALTGKTQQLHQSNDSGISSNSQQQVIPTPSANDTATQGSVSSPSVHSMKPPPPPSAQSNSSSLSTTSILNQGRVGHQRIAPMPGTCSSDDGTEAALVSIDEKKQQKRAANRKSAQLSRKRKKQFIEELKEENDELRRKEHILRSIPDLIVVFDSSGKLAFVSESVSRFLSIPAMNLEGTSFWERMCHDSVKLLKAAFMDSLAAREPNADSAPLGSGLWELRLLDKDRKYVLVTLNGVVHFTGDTPECVCCIRPLHQKSIQDLPKERKSSSPKVRSRLVSSSDGSRSSDDSGSTEDQSPAIRVDPSQSVMGSDNFTEDNSGEDERPREEGDLAKQNRKNPSVSVDSGEVSESSGSDDGGASS